MTDHTKGFYHKYVRFRPVNAKSASLFNNQNRKTRKFCQCRRKPLGLLQSHQCKKSTTRVISTHFIFNFCLPLEIVVIIVISTFIWFKMYKLFNKFTYGSVSIYLSSTFNLATISKYNLPTQKQTW